MRITRLSLANLKKHKLESVSLFLLLMLCMTIISSAISGITRIDDIFDEAFNRTSLITGVVMVPETSYKKEYSDFFENDQKIEYSCTINGADSQTITKYLDKNGHEVNSIMTFVTEEGDSELENVVIESSLTHDEILSKEHFIILPYYLKLSKGFKEGDEFTIIHKEKKYPFEVVGFYESAFYSNDTLLKFIVSDNDLELLGRLFTAVKIMGFKLPDGIDDKSFILDEFYPFAENIAVGREVESISNSIYSSEASMCTSSAKTLMSIMLIMAVVIFISVAIIIRFRIKSDIDEQLASIGVLEALGYKSDEISYSYVIEYLLIAIPAVAGGLLLNIVTAPLFVRIGEMTVGHKANELSVGTQPLLIGFIMLFAIMVISYFRAVRIRKIPPVVAFRKGTEDHTHKINFLPMEKAKGSVHLRIAIKGFIADLKSNFGMGICITISVIALMICFVIFDFTGDGINLLVKQSGIDLSDFNVKTTIGTDLEEFSAEISEMPDVRKVSISNDYASTYVLYGINTLNVYAADFDESENIHPVEGRLPKHDNEVALTDSFMKDSGKKVGDTIKFKIGKIEADYVIVGYTKTAISLFEWMYVTEDGYKRIEPSYKPDQINIFLNEGVDRTEFKNKLFEKYGAAAAGYEANTDSSASLEDRIRAEADQKISDMLELYDVNSIDYAIQIGDQIIKGSSSKFKIKEAVSSIEDILSLISGYINAIAIGTGAFMFISLGTMLLIVFLIVYTAIKKQRLQLGILKGMGYTSKELMFQTAVKILPMLIFSVVLGSIAGIMAAKLIYSKYGDIPVVAFKVVILALFVIVFGFAVAYLSARRIKNISVYELMQE